MPKNSSKLWNGRGGRKLAFHDDQEKHFFDHDDRVMGDLPMKFTKSTGGNGPRVSFKNQSRIRDRDRGRTLEVAVKNFLDDDFSMTSGLNNNSRNVIVQHSRGRGGSRGQNSPVESKRGFKLLKKNTDQTIWYSSMKTQSYKISIPYGNRFEKSFVVNNLRNYMAPETFVPIMYRNHGNASVFFVDSEKAANSLKECDDKITAGDNFRLHVRVEAAFPQYNLDQAMRDKMKQAMVKRYVQDTNALDLSCFHHDPDLVDDYFCALSRPSILVAVLDIIKLAIPNLEALNLDNNQLCSVEKLTLMSKTLSCIKILYLGDNKIREINNLNSIRELPLEELRLTGNPLCKKYTQRPEDYVSEIRAKFPKLLRLDGVELSRPIGFDVENEGTKLPRSHRMFIANEKAREIASQFLQQYFLIFDSDNRQPLLDAYHEHACFSLTLSQPHANNKLDHYNSDNRNFKRVVDPAKRKKLLKLGRLPVVSYIAEMPKTRHDLASFTMDICLVTDAMMVINVAGLFKEIEKKDEPIRYFNRTFIIVPEGNGYCIQNEQLHIAQVTQMQEKKAFQSTSMQVPAQVSVEITEQATSSTMTPTATLSDEVRQQMTLTLSQHTNMKLEWSLKCLKEVDWNFDVALAAFHEFFKLGRIPPEALK